MHDYATKIRIIVEIKKNYPIRVLDLIFFSKFAFLNEGSV